MQIDYLGGNLRKQKNKGRDSEPGRKKALSRMHYEQVSLVGNRSSVPLGDPLKNI